MSDQYLTGEEKRTVWGVVEARGIKEINAKMFEWAVDGWEVVNIIPVVEGESSISSSQRINNYTPLDIRGSGDISTKFLILFKGQVGLAWVPTYTEDQPSGV